MTGSEGGGGRGRGKQERGKRKAQGHGESRRSEREGEKHGERQSQSITLHTTTRECLSHSRSPLRRHLTLQRMAQARACIQKLGDAPNLAKLLSVRQRSLWTRVACVARGARAPACKHGGDRVYVRAGAESGCEWVHFVPRKVCVFVGEWSPAIVNLQEGRCAKPKHAVLPPHPCHSHHLCTSLYPLHSLAFTLSFRCLASPSSARCVCAGEHPRYEDRAERGWREACPLSRGREKERESDGWKDGKTQVNCKARVRKRERDWQKSRHQEQERNHDGSDVDGACHRLPTGRARRQPGASGSQADARVPLRLARGRQLPSRG